MSTDRELRLETERLLLRPWRVSEAAVQRQLWLERDPRVPARRRIDADGQPTLAEMEEWIRTADQPTTTGLLAVERKDVGDVIGYCGLVDNGPVDNGPVDNGPVDNGPGGEGEPELAYELLRRVWGQGYATEAAWAVLDWARTSGCERVWATVWDWNTASRRVLAKLGFTETERQEVDAVHGTNLVTTRAL